jgi:transposase-like protein
MIADNAVPPFPIRIHMLLDEEKTCTAIRSMRWREGVFCTRCNSSNVKKYGKSNRSCYLQRYKCRCCNKRFDDLTDIIFSGSHHSVCVWIILIYFVGLDLSNRQIAAELGLDQKVVHQMATSVRKAIYSKKPQPRLSGIAECDEAYFVAGHKGHPEAVRRKNRVGRRRRLKGARGRSTLEKEKPPIFGMVQRGGDVAIFMLPNVQMATIQPFIRTVISPGTEVHTDEYLIYGRLAEWGYPHKTVCHAKGEYARDEDGDGHHEVHVNTMEGFWSLLRSWLRPHRGVSQENPPYYLGLFEFVHNVRRRGKELLSSLIGLLVAAEA